MKGSQTMMQSLDSNSITEVASDALRYNSIKQKAVIEPDLIGDICFGCCHCSHSYAVDQLPLSNHMFEYHLSGCGAQMKKLILS